MSKTVIKFPIAQQSTEAIMIIFKTQGIQEGAENIFEMSINNSEYFVEIVPTEDTKKNKLLLKEFGGLFTTEGRLANIYINGILAPINNAEVSLNEWTSLIIRFRSSASSDSVSYFSVNGVTKTNISLFSSYSLPLETKGESIISNSWAVIDNEDWQYYSDSKTWSEVFASIKDIQSFSGIGSVWETFLGTNKIAQQQGAFEVDEEPFLKTSQYQYKTYFSTTKESIYQSPA
jgi:hypothetical protein